MAGIAGLCLALLAAPTGRSAASPLAAEGAWSKATVLFEDSSVNGRVADPRIIADSTGDVHVFWNYIPDSTKLESYVMYAKFDGTSWSKPNDVIAGGQTGRPLVALDDRGTVHVAWGNSYYRAPLGAAGQAGGWSKRSSLGFSGTASSLQIDGHGTLHVVYTKQENTMVVGYVRGTDYGAHWSPESTLPGVVELDDPTEAQSSPEMAIDAHGGVHVVWTDYSLPAGWPPVGTFYARSTDGGDTWEGPFRLMGGSHGQPGILIDSKNVIHIVWRGTSDINGTYYVSSKDEGATWTGPDKIQPDGGFSGDQTIREDSAGNVHLITSDAAEQVWDGKSWRLDETNRDKCEQADLAVSRGNLLYLACSGVNAQAVHNRILVFSRQTGAPQLAAQAVPTVAPSPTPVRSVTPSPTAAPVAGPSRFANNSPRLTSVSSTNIIVYSVAPVLALLVGVLVWRSRRSR